MDDAEFQQLIAQDAQPQMSAASRALFAALTLPQQLLSRGVSAAQELEGMATGQRPNPVLKQALDATQTLPPPANWQQTATTMVGSHIVPAAVEFALLRNAAMPEFANTTRQVGNAGTFVTNVGGRAVDSTRTMSSPNIWNEIIADAAAGATTQLSQSPEEAALGVVEGAAFGGMRLLPRTQRILPAAGLAVTEKAVLDARYPNEAEHAVSPGNLGALGVFGASFLPGIPKSFEVPPTPVAGLPAFESAARGPRIQQPPRPTPDPNDTALVATGMRRNWGPLPADVVREFAIPEAPQLESMRPALPAPQIQLALPGSPFATVAKRLQQMAAQGQVTRAEAQAMFQREIQRTFDPGGVQAQSALALQTVPPQLSPGRIPGLMQGVPNEPQGPFADVVNFGGRDPLAEILYGQTPPRETLQDITAFPSGQSPINAQLRQAAEEYQQRLRERAHERTILEQITGIPTVPGRRASASARTLEAGARAREAAEQFAEQERATAARGKLRELPEYRRSEGGNVLADMLLHPNVMSGGIGALAGSFAPAINPDIDPLTGAVIGAAAGLGLTNLTRFFRDVPISHPDRIARSLDVRFDGNSSAHHWHFTDPKTGGSFTIGVNATEKEFFDALARMRENFARPMSVGDQEMLRSLGLDPSLLPSEIRPQNLTKIDPVTGAIVPHEPSPLPPPERLAGPPRHPFSRVEFQSEEALAISDQLRSQIKNWLEGSGPKPEAPNTLYRGIPKGATPRLNETFTHVTPWPTVAEREGKFVSPRSVDVYSMPGSADTLYYRGGAMAESPFETTRIRNAKGMTWDEVLQEAQKIYNVRKLRAATRVNNDPELSTWSPADREITIRENQRHELNRTLDDIRNATLEADASGRPGVWRNAQLPARANRPHPDLLTTQEIADAKKVIRLYRAETDVTATKQVPEWLKNDPEYLATIEASGRWFSDSMENAEYYAKNFGNGKITYIDIPASQLETFRASNLPAGKFSAVGRAQEEFFLPKDLAITRKPIPVSMKKPSGPTGLTGGYIVPELARFFAGFAVGSLEGGMTTPEGEDKTSRAIIHGLIGASAAAFGPSLFKGVLATIAKHQTTPVTGKQSRARNWQAVVDVFTKPKIAEGFEELSKEGVFRSNMGVARMANWLDKNLGITLPTTVRNAIINSRGMASHLVNIADTALAKTNFWFNPSQDIKDLSNKFLDGGFGKGNTAAAQYLAALPTEAKIQEYGNFIVASRVAITGLQKMIGSAITDDVMRFKIYNSLDKYVSRSYRLFSDPHFQASDAEIKKFAEDTARIFPHLNVDTLRQQVHQYIRDVKMASSSPFKPRVELAPEFRELIGEIVDPSQRIYQTLARLRPIAEITNFYGGVVRKMEIDGMPAWFDSDASLEAFRGKLHQLQAGLNPDSSEFAMIAKKLTSLGTYQITDKVPNFGIFTGGRVNRHIYDQMLQFQRQTEWSSPFFRAVATGHTMVKLARTAFNPLVLLRNYLTMPVFMAIGRVNHADLQQTWEILRNPNHKLQKELIEWGIIGADQIRGELYRDLRTLTGGRFSLGNIDLSPIGMGQYDLRAGEKLLTRGVDAWLKLYRAPDVAVRVATYMGAKRRFGGDIEKAVNWTNRYTMNYDMVAPLVKKARQMPFMNLFMSYTAEMMRIGKNLTVDAVKGNPLLQNRRDPYAWAVLGSLVAIPEIFQQFSEHQLSAKDRKDWDQVKTLLPDYARTRYRWVSGRQPDGSFRYFDITPFLIQDNFQQMAKAAAAGDWDAALAVNPFVGWENTPLLNIIASNMAGKDRITDRPFRGTADRVASVAKELVPPWMPYVGSDYYKWHNALLTTKSGEMGITSSRSGVKYSPEDLLWTYVTGIKRGNYSLPHLIERKQREVSDHLNVLRAYTNDVIRSDAHPTVKDRAIHQFRIGAAEILEEFRATMGLPDKEADQLTADLGR